MDGFRSFIRPDLDGVKDEEILVDRACLLDLTAPELSVLVGGLRVLGIGAPSTSPMTNRVGTSSNDFFVNLLHRMGKSWRNL
jgi:catalase-peroxidase